MKKAQQLILELFRPEALPIAVSFIAEHDDKLKGPCTTCIKSLASFDMVRVLFDVDAVMLADEIACFRINNLGIKDSICLDPTHERIRP